MWSRVTLPRSWKSSRRSGSSCCASARGVSAPSPLATAIRVRKSRRVTSTRLQPLLAEEHAARLRLVLAIRESEAAIERQGGLVVLLHLEGELRAPERARLVLDGLEEAAAETTPLMRRRHVQV